MFGFFKSLPIGVQKSIVYGSGAFGLPGQKIVFPVRPLDGQITANVIGVEQATVWQKIDHSRIAGKEEVVESFIFENSGSRVR